MALIGVSAVWAALGRLVAPQAPVHTVTQTHGNKEGCTNPACLSPDVDKAIGFSRPEMGSKVLSGSLKPYARHIFCSGGKAASWPAKAAEKDALSSAIASSVKEVE